MDEKRTQNHHKSRYGKFEFFENTIFHPSKITRTKFLENDRLNCFISTRFKGLIERRAKAHHVYSRLKRHGNHRFHVVSTWNTHGVFAGKIQDLKTLL